MRVTLPSGALLFCAHHGRENAAALASVAINIQDETSRLIESETASI